MKKLLFATLFTLLVSTATQAQVVSNACDRSLWDRVYSPYRFNPGANPQNTKEPTHRCVQIRGTIAEVRQVNPEGDGDIDISINPDNEKVLRPGQHTMGVEIVCADNTPAIHNARGPCKDYHLPSHLSYDYVRRFKKGQRVEIIGELVTDYGHAAAGRAEIHPVSRISAIN